MSTWQTSIMKARVYAKELGVSHIKDRSHISLINAINDCLNDEIDVESIKRNMLDVDYTQNLISNILNEVSLQTGISVDNLKG